MQLGYKTPALYDAKYRCLLPGLCCAVSEYVLLAKRNLVPGARLLCHIYINTLRPRPTDSHFADDILKCISWIKKCINCDQPFTEVCSEGSNQQYFNIGSGNGLALIRRKPLSEPMMFRLPTHTYVTRPKWDYRNKCNRLKTISSRTWFWNQIRCFYETIHYKIIQPAVFPILLDPESFHHVLIPLSNAV